MAASKKGKIILKKEIIRRPYIEYADKVGKRLQTRKLYENFARKANIMCKIDALKKECIEKKRENLRKRLEKDLNR